MLIQIRGARLVTSRKLGYGKQFSTEMTNTRSLLFRVYLVLQKYLALRPLNVRPLRTCGSATHSPLRAEHPYSPSRRDEHAPTALRAVLGLRGAPHGAISKELLYSVLVCLICLCVPEGCAYFLSPPGGTGGFLVLSNTT